jgi:hypothetical protein
VLAACDITQAVTPRVWALPQDQLIAARSG